MGAACCGADRKVYTVEQRKLKEGRADESFKFSFKNKKNDDPVPKTKKEPVPIQEPEEEEYQLDQRGFVGT